MTFFWSGIGSGFGEPSGTPPPRIPRSKPPVTPGLVNPAQKKKSLNVSGLLTYPSIKVPITENLLFSYLKLHLIKITSAKKFCDLNQRRFF